MKKLLLLFLVATAHAVAAPTTVDADSLFPIGSTTKAMTVAALATLVDAGKISWDDKVVDGKFGDFYE